MTESTPPPGSSRRTFMRRAAVAGGIAAGLPAAASGQESLQTVVVPAVEPVDEYRAQLLFVGDPNEVDAEHVPQQADPGELPEDEPADVPLDECDLDIPWPAERTTALDARLIDRHADEQVSYEVPVYVDEDQDVLEEGNYYITHATSFCTDDYVATRVESIREDEVPAFDPDDADDPDDDQEPQTAEGARTETPTEEATPPVFEDIDVPGFGALAAVAGVAGALVVRLLRDRRRG